MLDDSSMLVEAAVLGQGVGLARWSLALGDLAAGRLVMPLPHLGPMPTGHAYYLAAPRENRARAPVAAFCDWLFAEAAELRAPIGSGSKAKRGVEKPRGRPSRARALTPARSA